MIGFFHRGSAHTLPIMRKIRLDSYQTWPPVREALLLQVRREGQFAMLAGIVEDFYTAI